MDHFTREIKTQVKVNPYLKVYPYRFSVVSFASFFATVPKAPRLRSFKTRLGNAHSLPEATGFANGSLRSVYLSPDLY